MAFQQGVAQTIHVTTVVTTDHLTPTAPGTPVVTVSEDGGASFGASDNTAATTLYGISLVLSATETNRAAVGVRVTSANCDPAVAWFYFEDSYTAAKAAFLDAAVTGVPAAVILALPDTYQAKVWLQDDDLATTPADRYVVCWYKNGEPVVAGITTPLIQVIKGSDGTDLVASQAMAQIGTTGLYGYSETTAAKRIVDGATYIAKATATIGGSARTWYQPVGRDT